MCSFSGKKTPLSNRTEWKWTLPEEGKIIFQFSSFIIKVYNKKTSENNYLKQLDVPVEWTRHFSSFSWCLIWLYIRIYNSLIVHQSRVKCLENCNHMLLQVEACIYFRVHIQFTSQTNAILNFSLHLKVLIFSIILYLIYDTQPCFPTPYFCPSKP